MGAVHDGDRKGPRFVKVTVPDVPVTVDTICARFEDAILWDASGRLLLFGVSEDTRLSGFGG